MNDPQNEKADDTLSDYQSILEGVVDYTNDLYGLDADEMDVALEIHRNHFRGYLYATFELSIDDVIRTDDGLTNLARNLREIATTIEERLRVLLKPKKGT